MQLNVTVQLGDGETLDLDANEVATRCLQAVGGNPETDECIAFVQVTAEPGRAGPSREVLGSPPEET